MLCWPLQMVQYLSQVQYSSVLSHCVQRICWRSPGMCASEKNVPEESVASKRGVNGDLQTGKSR